MAQTKKNESDAFAAIWSDAQAHGWALIGNEVVIPCDFWCAIQTIMMINVDFEGRTISVPHAIFNPSFRVCGHSTRAEAARYAARRLERNAIPPPDLEM